MNIYLAQNRYVKEEVEPVVVLPGRLVAVVDGEELNPTEWIVLEPVESIEEALSK